MLDKWDYCLRKLFVLKSTKLERAIGYATIDFSIHIPFTHFCLCFTP